MSDLIDSHTHAKSSRSAVYLEIQDSFYFKTFQSMIEYEIFKREYIRLIDILLECELSETSLSSISHPIDCCFVANLGEFKRKKVY
jgi:hypothetical protein